MRAFIHALRRCVCDVCVSPSQRAIVVSACKIVKHETQQVRIAREKTLLLANATCHTTGEGCKREHGKKAHNAVEQRVSRYKVRHVQLHSKLRLQLCHRCTVVDFLGKLRRHQRGAEPQSSLTSASYSRSHSIEMRRRHIARREMREAAAAP